MNEKFINDLSKIVIGAAIEVHTELGPGLLESAYEACLYYELVNKGLIVERQKSIPLKYKTIEVECGFRIDLLIENKLIIELKTVEKFLPIHTAQLLTYLKLTNLPLGLLLNFNTYRLGKAGIKRIVHNMPK